MITTLLKVLIIILSTGIIGCLVKIGQLCAKECFSCREKRETKQHYQEILADDKTAKIIRNLKEIPYVG